jgi:hypothetical protein
MGEKSERELRWDEFEPTESAEDTEPLVPMDGAISGIAEELDGHQAWD